MKFGFFAPLAALASTAPLAAAQADVSLAELLSSSENFTILETFLNATGLLEVLDTDGLDVTVFAPDDEAFGKVDTDLAATLLTPEWVEHTKCILNYHVVPAIVLSTDLSEGMMLPTLEGTNLTISLDPSPTVTGVANTAGITAVDIEATNGVAHVIDEVLLPTCITASIFDLGAADGNFSTLVELVQLAGLEETLSGPGPFTLFAPPNSAFEALGEDTLAFLQDPANTNALQSVLLHHVFSGNLYSTTLPADFTTVPSALGTTGYFDGESLRINGVPIVDTDVLASNGVIHVIEEVMLLPSIIDLLEDAEEFTGGASFESLLTALNLTGLDAVLEADDENNPTQWTLLAPTDDAIDGAPELLGKFLQPGWETHLTEVLLYHVLSGAVNSTVVASLETAETASGESINITASDAGIMINDANVVSVDNTAYNGIIHAIDQVLLPPPITMDIVEIAASNPDFSSLVGAVGLAGLAEDLSGEGPLTVFAPTNEAFEKLNASGIDPTMIDTELLTSVLLYHVIGENVVLDNGAMPTTLQGANLSIAVSTDDDATVNDAAISGQVFASNGIIYIIDTVLIPPDDAPTTTPVDMPTVAPVDTPTVTPSSETNGMPTPTDMPMPTDMPTAAAGSATAIRCSVVAIAAWFSFFLL